MNELLNFTNVKSIDKAMKPNSGIVRIFNPNPYPVVVTSDGHVLGGRSFALVYSNDNVFVKVLQRGWVIVEEGEITPDKPSRRSK